MLKRRVRLEMLPVIVLLRKEASIPKDHQLLQLPAYFFPQFVTWIIQDLDNYSCERQ